MKANACLRDSTFSNGTLIKHRSQVFCVHDGKHRGHKNLFMNVKTSISYSKHELFLNWGIVNVQVIFDGSEIYA